MECVGFELRETQSFLNSEFYSKGEASLGLAGFLSCLYGLVTMAAEMWCI